jgi:ATP-binding cassette, subfamily F, member 3
MFEFQDVDKTFQEEPLFSKATFGIGTGERCAIVGRNGTGKTTLFKLITKEEKPDAGTITIPKGYTFGYLKQHMGFTKETVIEEAQLGLRPEESDALYKVEKILFGLGFKEEDLNKPLSAFSGGFHLRINLAKVLVAEPDCLLLDEPTNFLDILAIRFLTKFLQNWDKECLIISHDRDFLDNTCTHTLGVHRQKIYKVEGGTQKLFSLILEEEERYEKTRQNLEKKRAHAEKFVERFGAKASKATQAESRKKMIAKMPVLEKLAHLYHLNFSFNFKTFPGQKMLQADHLGFSYESKPLIHDVSLEIEREERIAFIGKNGEGKSTLLRLLVGELKPISGHIKRSDNTVIGYFGQSNIERLDPKMTIEEEISEANPALNRTQVRAICGQMCFPGDAALKKISQLSGGERSRVLLGKILSKPCNLILLDEPTNHLDIESVEALLEALEDFPGSVVMITHSELILTRIAFKKLIVCRPGRQELFLGSYEDFLEKDGWAEEEKKEVKEKKPSAYHDDKKQQGEQNLKAGKIKKDIAILEKQIEGAEKAIEEMTDALAIATQQKESDLVVRLSKDLQDKIKECEELYERFYQLHN